MSMNTKRNRSGPLSCRAIVREFNRQHFAGRPLVVAMCSIFLLVGCAAATQRAHNHKSDLPSRLDAIFASQPGAVYGCRVVDLGTGREIYSHNPDLPLMPASNLKLFVTATALDDLGPNYPLRTTLGYDGKNLWIIGGGDPACGDPSMSRARHEPITAMFDRWANVLRSKGIDRIAGNLYYDARIFDQQLVNPSWDHSLLGEWYAAPVSGLNFNDNCIDITLWPTKSGQPMRVSFVPPTNLVRIINETRKGKGAGPDVYRRGMADVYVVHGNSTKKTRLDSKPVTDPAAFFADALRTNLKSHGISIAGRSMSAPQGPNHAPRTLAVHQTRLADAIKRMDKDSQNLFAEALDKLVGHVYAMEALHKDEPGSWPLGSAAAHAFLTRHHINASALVMVDGSGLSRQDRITVRQMTEMLRVVHHASYSAAFSQALPISGVDGTIKHRMTDIPGKVLGKTGFISGVRSLSGYITTRHGHTLVYSIIYNQIKGGVMPYQKVQDRICEELVRTD